MSGHLLDLRSGILAEQAFFCSAVSLLLRLLFFCFPFSAPVAKALVLAATGTGILKSNHWLSEWPQRQKVLIPDQKVAAFRCCLLRLILVSEFLI